MSFNVVMHNNAILRVIFRSIFTLSKNSNKIAILYMKFLYTRNQMILELLFYWTIVCTNYFSAFLHVLFKMYVYYLKLHSLCTFLLLGLLSFTIRESCYYAWSSFSSL